MQVTVGGCRNAVEHDRVRHIDATAAASPMASRVALKAGVSGSHGGPR